MNEQELLFDKSIVNQSKELKIDKSRGKKKPEPARTNRKWVLLLVILTTLLALLFWIKGQFSGSEVSAPIEWHR